jgi:SAM-dependent methyltransferase
MTTKSGVGTSHLGTTADDYTGCYYASHLGSDEEYGWDSPSWRAFFTNVADKVVTLLGAKRVLDVGCARGLLVQALAEAGVDAHGSDISETAVASAHPDVRGRLSVATAVDPIEGSWDLVSCIEVVEHMSPLDADRAITNMCAVTERVLFSSGPGDYAEPTHVNVRPPAEWAAAFAERGFFRRTDIDLGFLTPWAVLFERADLDTRSVVHRYEAYAFPMRVEVLDKRAALLDAHRTISVLHDAEQSSKDAEQSSKDAEQSSEIVELKRRLLTLRDHAIGAEAAVEAAKAEVEVAKTEAQFATGHMHRALTELAAVKQSRTWRTSQKILSPARVVRRIRHRR